MDGIREPVSPALAAVLRSAVFQLATTERRRVLPTLLHVGRPGGREVVFGASADDGPWDQSLRTDVVAAMLHRCGPDPLIWLTRHGPLVDQDDDLAWLAAARAAAAEAEIPLTMVVVNRHGWRDPRTGVGRTWRRPRRR
ncbi:MAG: hypothetical protein F2667_10375 [Actinobacteria bacterium]|uniref:Unannotated protein n=1 Tax=freshwater metagenome TaxID=449393 RepID=A0A6J6RAY9_9ZZZZ|nr:hypothetical protein [Actinomycetota bacterium]